MKFKRRDLLKAAGATAALSPLSGCGIGRLESRPEDLYAQEWSQHEERKTAAVCDMCPGGCGIELRTVDGTVVGIRGNPRSPVNRGGLCPRAHALIQLNVHPERVTQPLKRTGETFQPISWDQALGEIAETLAKMRSSGAPERLVIVGGTFRGVLQEALDRFARAFGTPNLIRYRRYDYDQPAVSHRLATGTSLPLAYDIGAATYILSFTGNLLEDGPSPLYQMRAVAEARTRPQDPARYVEVGARPSISSGKADRWIPVRPGQEAALALGMAYVIVREGLYDRRFVAEATAGFEDWTDKAGKHDGFKTWLLKNHSPKITEQVTGVPVTTLIEEARWFAQSPHPLAVGEPPDSFGAADPQARLAILSLNALVGAIGKPGGVLLQPLPPLRRLAEPRIDETARRGLKRPRLDGAAGDKLANDVIQNLPGNILQDRPYPVEALLMIRSNPVFSHPLGTEFKKALAKVPLSVSITSFLDESARLATIVLPESTALECWTEDEISHLAGFTLVSVGRPAMRPAHDTRPAYEILTALASKLGGPVAASLAHPTIEQAIKARVQGLWEARRGYVIRERKSEELRRVIQGQGYWDREHADFEAFFAALVEAGGWWDPDNAIPSFRRRYRTPSGKYEFDSGLLRRFLAGGQANGTLVTGLPEFIPPGPAIPAGAAENYPYQLKTFSLLTSLERHSVNVPILQEMPTPQFEDQAWAPWIEIDPRLAEKLGIRDGNKVWVVSPKARVRTTARLVPGAFEDVVSMPVSMGHASSGRWTERDAAEPAAILVDVEDRLKGIGVPSATFVRLEKV